MNNAVKLAEIKHSPNRRIAGGKKTIMRATFSERGRMAGLTARALSRGEQKSKAALNSENYAEIAGLNAKQFKAFIYLIATAINFDDVNSLIKKYYPKFSEKRKLNFLIGHFNICGIFGKNLNVKIRYLFVVKSILSAARSMGPDFVIKK